MRRYGGPMPHAGPPRAAPPHGPPGPLGPPPPPGTLRADGPLRRLYLTIFEVLAAPANLTPSGQRHVFSTAALIGTMIVTGADRDTFDTIVEERTEGRDAIADFGNALGEPALNLGFLSTFGAVGYFADSPRAWATFESGLMSAFVTGALVGPTLKFVFGRERPEVTADIDGEPTHFHPFSSEASFPSGHTMFAFSLAGTISHYYPGFPGVLAVIAASSTAFARVYDRHHWPSDVVAGAALGYGIAQIVAETHDRADAGDLVLVPMMSDAYSGILLKKRF